MNKYFLNAFNWEKNPIEFTFMFLVIALLAYYSFSYLMPSNSARITSTDGKGIADLVLVYAPWCGHSKAMLSDYDRVINDYHGKQINGYTLNILKYNSDVDKQEVEKRNIKGFPSLFFEKGGESSAFNKRKYQNIVDELKNLLS